jgi:hypothetical protein
MGRTDDQVKIRGFRIEPSEIKAVLEQHPAVREAVVLVRDKESGERYLAAYVVPLKGQDVGDGDLRNFLKTRLPDYMLPASFVLLESLPLTPNGKVDRRALPAAESPAPERRAGYAPPQTEIERIVADVWGQVLQLERVSIHDSFFDLGGHSLLMIKANSKLREALNRDIPIVAMFDHPTVCMLARYLSQGQAESSSLQKIRDRANRQKAVYGSRRPGEDE